MENLLTISLCFVFESFQTLRLGFSPSPLLSPRPLLSPKLALAGNTQKFSSPSTSRPKKSRRFPYRALVRVGEGGLLVES